MEHLNRGEHITSVQVSKFSVPLHWFNITTMMKAWLNETRGSVGPGLWQGKEMLLRTCFRSIRKQKISVQRQ
ncbi:hypothetical protein GSY23_20760 [Escherichia coli]|nr:hypothetical protein [Escherichia coli]EFX6130022.1 hypothetical protein [Shigella boydii]